jgi:hypothetical protein
MLFDTESRVITVREATMGNVLIRMCCCETEVGTRFAIFLFAYNSWADQQKLIYAACGLDEEIASDFFEETARIVSGFSWVDDAFIIVR